MRPAEQIDVCRASHQRLIIGLADVTDADFRRPSLLPGYSRGHLVTHIANKARAHVRLFEGAAVGEMRRVHPVGYDPDHAASVGAGRSALQLRTDLSASFDVLEAAWDGLDPGLWGREALMTSGSRTMIEVVAHHLRNVEVHHLDLDIGYRASDWPEVFVDAELAKRLQGLPARTNRSELLAWLLDRAPAPELAGPW